MWRAMSLVDVKRRLAAAEVSALSTAAKGSDQTADDILNEAINDVTEEVRGYVAGCRQNVLGEAGTIPSELMSAATTLVRNYLFTRLPGMKALNDELRQKETEQAIAKLLNVSSCKLAVVQPETPAASNQQAAGPGAQLVSSRTRRATRDTLGGLL